MKQLTLVVNARPLTKRVVLGSALLVVFAAITIGFLLLNPIWTSLSPPFPILKASPPITAPVDGPYYIQNAQQGYQWETKDGLSLWYHPLMSGVVSFLPNWLAANYWFWLISVLCAIGSLVLVYKIAAIYSPNGNNISPFALLWVLLIPGGLSLGTGNPEIPTLFFSSLLLLSVVKWKIWPITVLAAVASILTKPNALYMVPMLTVYSLAGFREKDRALTAHSLVGILSIFLTWFLWIAVVDLQADSWGAYWNARILFSEYVAGDPASYFLEAVKSLSSELDLRNAIRYSTGLLIPIVNLFIIGATSFSCETHRYALAASNLSMLFLVLWQGNPNKVIVYSTTIPGYFAVFTLYIGYQLCERKQTNRRVLWQFLLLLYISLMLAVYALGTPLGWYF